MDTSKEIQYPQIQGVAFRTNHVFLVQHPVHLSNLFSFVQLLHLLNPLSRVPLALVLHLCLASLIPASTAESLAMLLKIAPILSKTSRPFKGFLEVLPNARARAMCQATRQAEVRRGQDRFIILSHGYYTGRRTYVDGYIFYRQPSRGYCF